MKRWALGGVLVLASVTAWGMETDPFLGIDVELEDGLPELQGFILEEFRAGVARVNQDASLRNGLCIQVAEQITADLRKDVNRRPFSKLTRVAQWIHQEGKMDVYPPATVKPRKYRRQSIYGTRWYDVLFDVELARAFQAGSIRISADKIGHFLGFGLYYYTTFFEERSTGKSEDEAVRAAIQVGIEAEMAKYGRKWSKVFSVSDLEANYQGFLFYRALCEPAPPDGESGTSTHTLRLVKDADGDRWSLEGQMDLSTFVNPNWDEAFNPSVFGRHWDTGEAEPGRERRFWRAVRRRMHEHCPKLQLPEVRQRLCSYRDYMNRQGISRNMEVMRQLEDARSFPERQQFSIFDVCQASSSCQ